MKKCECCDRTLSERARKETCPNCRRIFWYWDRTVKGVSPLLRVIARANQLNLWNTRMTYMGETMDPARFRKALKHIPEPKPLTNGNHRARP